MTTEAIQINNNKTDQVVDGRKNQLTTESKDDDRLLSKRDSKMANNNNSKLSLGSETNKDDKDDTPNIVVVSPVQQE